MSKPAARITDMHTCPMVTPGTPPVPHVGGPILPPGKPTVFIGNIPAAVLGDKCVCVGPPDTIVMGSFVVLIGGKPAARMGDNTMHGGVIAVGCPTVLIGDGGGGASMDGGGGGKGNTGWSGAKTPCTILGKLQKAPTNEAEKKEQALLQKELEKSVHNNLGDLPQEKRQGALDALAHYKESSDAADMARLSEAVYSGDTPLGYKKLDAAELKKLGLSEDYLVEKETLGPLGGKNPHYSGFKAAIYESTTGGDPKYTVAYAGSENKPWSEDNTDWTTNAAQGTGKQTLQYDKAMVIGNKLSKAHGSDGFRTTGHSLGGGLASATSATTGAKGTTFNSAGLHRATTGSDRKYGVPANTRAENENNVDAYYNSHDPLSKVQDNRELVLGGAGATAAALVSKIPLVGPFLAGGVVGGTLGLLASGVAPRAFGNRKEVQSEKGGLPLQHGIDDMVDLLDKESNKDLDKLKKDFGC